MRYLIEFRQPAHAFVYDAKHPGIIDPQPGVTEYIVDGEPPAHNLVTVTPFEPVPEG